MNTSRNLTVGLSVLLGATFGFAFHYLAPTAKPAAAAQLGSLPGRHLQPPWWETVSFRTTPKANTYVVPSDVLFALGSSAIGTQGHSVLAALAPQLRGALSITVAGCTDPEGGVDSSYNIALGLQRAQASVAVLEAAGLPASMFHVVSWADTHPVTNVARLDTPTINALDRRIMLIVTK